MSLSSASEWIASQRARAAKYKNHNQVRCCLYTERQRLCRHTRAIYTQNIFIRSTHANRLAPPILEASTNVTATLSFLSPFLISFYYFIYIVYKIGSTKTLGKLVAVAQIDRSARSSSSGEAEAEPCVCVCDGIHLQPECATTGVRARTHTHRALYSRLFGVYAPRPAPRTHTRTCAHTANERKNK